MRAVEILIRSGAYLSSSIHPTTRFASLSGPCVFSNMELLGLVEGCSAQREMARGVKKKNSATLARITTRIQIDRNIISVGAKCFRSERSQWN